MQINGKKREQYYSTTLLFLDGIKSKGLQTAWICRPFALVRSEQYKKNPRIRNILFHQLIMPVVNILMTL